MNDYENKLIKKFENGLINGDLKKAELIHTMFLDTILSDFDAKIEAWKSMGADLSKAQADKFWDSATPAPEWLPISELGTFDNGTKLWGYYPHYGVLFGRIGFTAGSFFATVSPTAFSPQWDKANQPTHIMLRTDDNRPEPPKVKRFRKGDQVLDHDGGKYTIREVLSGHEYDYRVISWDGVLCFADDADLEEE